MGKSPCTVCSKDTLHERLLLCDGQLAEGQECPTRACSYCANGKDVPAGNYYCTSCQQNPANVTGTKSKGKGKRQERKDAAAKNPKPTGKEGKVTEDNLRTEKMDTSEKTCTRTPGRPTTN